MPPLRLHWQAGMLRKGGEKAVCEGTEGIEGTKGFELQSFGRVLDVVEVLGVLVVLEFPCAPALPVCFPRLGTSLSSQ